jgi:predicted enzyme related to lactoylglutathione lyase
MASNRYRQDVDAILARRRDNGADYWATPDGRLAVGEPFSTLTALLILHELKVARSHEAVRGALGLVREAWRSDGRYRLAPSGAIYPCATASAARVLCRFGQARDRRLRQTLVHLLETQHDDGGWRCNKFPWGRGPETRFSNPGVTLLALDAFRFTEDLNRHPRLDRAVDTLLEHWIVRRPIGPCHFGIGSLFMQVEFPFLRYNLFYYVYVLSFYERARRDPRYLEALRLLQSKLDARGRVVVERPNRSLAGLSLCAAGRPSDLATARYREVVKNLEGGKMRNVILATTLGVTLLAGGLQADSPKPLPPDVGSGRVAWFDITTPDLARSKDFYAKLFDWALDPLPGTDQALEIVAGGAAIGTLRVADGKLSPFNGVVYVQVADIQASCKRSKELGGMLAPGFPFNLPDGRGAIALVLDPAGHPVGLYSRTPLPPAPPPAK